jgi:hypothetical protein
MTQLNLTGGARIGMANATWPFASLKVTSDRLDLNATIVGNLVFKPEDIISIEPYYMIPIIGQGIKINHRIPKYKEKVIFWTFKNPNEVIRQIKQTGFFDNSITTERHNDSDIIAERQKQGGFPVKIPFAIGIVVIWNILFIMDFLNFSRNGSEGIPLGNGAIGALGIAFLSCLLTLISKDFRRIVLKEGRELKDISRFLYFLMFISGVMLLSIMTFPK